MCLNFERDWSVSYLGQLANQPHLTKLPMPLFVKQFKLARFTEPTILIQLLLADFPGTLVFTQFQLARKLCDMMTSIFILNQREIHSSKMVMDDHDHHRNHFFIIRIIRIISLSLESSMSSCNSRRDGIKVFRIKDFATSVVLLGIELLFSFKKHCCFNEYGFVQCMYITNSSQLLANFNQLTFLAQIMALSFNSQLFFWGTKNLHSFSQSELQARQLDSCHLVSCPWSALFSPNTITFLSSVANILSLSFFCQGGWSYLTI